MPFHSIVPRISRTTIAIGIYLFNIEENNICFGPRRGYNLQDENHWVDVGRRFFLILCLFFAYYVVQMIRSLFVLLSAVPALHVISSVHSFLFLNEFLGLGTLALAHIYRFQYAGRYCACRIGNQCNEGLYNNGNFTNHFLNNQNFNGAGYPIGGQFGNGAYSSGSNPSSLVGNGTNSTSYSNNSNNTQPSNSTIAHNTMRSHLLVRRGEFILGIIIVSWVYLAFNWLMHLLSIRRKEVAANNAALPPV